MRRGEVYYMDFRPVIGSEQGGIRPAVVIQNDVGNRHSPTVIVALITSQDKPNLPTHVKVCAKDRLTPDSIVMMEQIRTVDKCRVGKFVCQLSSETMSKVDKALKISLDMRSEEKKGELMNDLKIFESKEFGKIRTSIIEGKPWFCLADICAALELTQPSKVKERLGAKGVNTIPTLTSGGTQNLLYVDEPNLYKAIFQSRKESAERFTDWVTGEVLPAIRQTGSYQKKLTPEEMMRVQLGMIDGHEERITKLENAMNVDYGQQRVLEKEVAKVVIDSLGGKDSPVYKEMSKKVFSECNHDIKDYFHVNSRNNIPRVRFDDAVEYIRNWQPCTNTKASIKEANRRSA